MLRFGHKLKKQETFNVLAKYFSATKIKQTHFGHKVKINKGLSRIIPNPIA
jgi:hypothetical protein